MASRFDDGGKSSLFSVREILAIGWVTATSLVFLNLFFTYINRRILEKPPRGVPENWPISVFYIRLDRLRPEWAIPVLVVAIVGFVLAVAYLRREENHGLVPVVVVGLVLLVLSNLLHGFGHGFVGPLATQQGYYRIAPAVADPLQFIGTYEANQLSYVVHARTHPPGAVLTFTFLDWLFGSPALVSAAIALFSLPVSALLVYRLVGTYYEQAVAQYTTLLFVLLPAIQIYSLASLDAIIATLMLAAVYFFTRESRWWAIGTFVCLLVASFQLFLFVFILPVLAVIALFRREKILPLVAIVLGLGGFYLLVDIALGYNYLNGFLIASNQQNPQGFLLLAEPSRYVFTRLEDIAELGLFFTPFLCLLAVRGLRGLWRDVFGGRGWLPANTPEREPFVIAGIAVSGFAAMLVAGVYHTGETARGAMYMYPFLMLPVAAAIRHIEPSPRAKRLLAAAVFGQTLLMQLIGSYLW